LPDSGKRCDHFIKLFRFRNNVILKLFQNRVRLYFYKQRSEVLSAFAFTKMLFFIIIFAFLTTATAAYAVLAFKNFDPSKNQKKFNPKNFRGLFQPTEEDIREFEKAEKEAAQAKTDEVKRLESAEKLSKVAEFMQIWRELPSRRNTLELLYIASKSENGEVYNDAAKSVLASWHKGEINDLSAEDLAQMLESHFWLLPTEQRTSGNSFGLNQEIADLRRKSSETK
jgi:hypothetical protein